MNYPLISEYIEAIKAAEDNLATLSFLRPVMDEDGNPIMSSGNFAVVFKMKDEQTGKHHAVKCFLKEQEGRTEAYRLIAEELEYVSSTFLTPIKYLDKELYVDTNTSEETEFPVLLMDWEEGMTLDKYIREHIDNQYELSMLAYQFSRLAMWLMPQSFAHGDLKPDNILVREDGTLVLVDYDGMYVPAMKGQKARELGSPDFRHPYRTENDFNEYIDDFSLASILLSLKAISLQPELLEKYGAKDRLLFSEKDYQDLSKSKIMDVIKSLIQDIELASLYSLFILASSMNNLSQVSFRLFNLLRPEKSQYEDNLSTTVTDEDLANAWTDEFGVKYSSNRRRLLKAPANIKEYSVIQGTKVICDNAFPNIIDIEYRWVKSHCEYPDYEEEIITWGSNLEKITIPQGLAKIGNKAFYKCNGLTTIKLPIGVVEIGDSAFCGCTNLRTISVPDSVSYLGRKVFSGCASLLEICLPINLKEIHSRAFVNCKSLKSIIFPHEIKKIGVHAFDHCTSLSSVDIPSCVEEILLGTFEGCTNLASVVLHDGLKRIGQSAFEGCKSLTHISFPKSMEEIGIAAFRWSGIQEVYISKNINIIRKEAFSCPNLISIKVDINNVSFDSRNDCNAIIETESNTLITGCLNSTIPNSVLTIGCYAFNGIKGLNTISIPNSVLKIDKYAFESCRELSTITIPNSVNEIGDCAFGCCYSLSSIFVSNYAIKLGRDIFQLCNEIPFIHIPLGTRDKFEELFPRFKEKLVERDDDDN